VQTKVHGSGSAACYLLCHSEDQRPGHEQSESQPALPLLLCCMAQMLEGQGVQAEEAVDRRGETGSQADINREADLVSARRREREFFQTSPDYAHLAPRMGTEYLAKMVRSTWRRSSSRASRGSRTPLLPCLPGLPGLAGPALAALPALQRPCAMCAPASGALVSGLLVMGGTGRVSPQASAAHALASSLSPAFSWRSKS